MNWTEINGWFTEADAEEYRRLVRSIPDESQIVEIGVYEGRSLASIVQVIKNKKLKVLAVDNFSMCSSSRFELNMKSIELELWIFLGSSSEACLYIGLTPNLVFIDGDHSYDGVKKDIELWWPLIPKGGVLAGHDYDSEVKQAVDEKFSNVTKGGHCMWSVVKQ